MANNGRKKIAKNADFEGIGKFTRRSTEASVTACFVEKLIGKCFGKFIYNTWWNSFSLKVAGLQSVTLLEQDSTIAVFLWPASFPVIFRTAFLQNTHGRLLLELATEIILKNSISDTCCRTTFDKIARYNIKKMWKICHLMVLSFFGLGKLMS